MALQQADIYSPPTDETGHAIEKQRSCMAIIWVHDGEKALDKPTLLNAVMEMTGVSSATFMRDEPPILAIDYCARDTRAARLVDSIRELGAYARIVGC